MVAIDRIHFLDEQRRNRRRSYRFTVFALIAVAVSGIPLCAIVAPLLIGAMIAIMHLADLVIDIPAEVWNRLHDVVFALPNVWSAVRGKPVEMAWGSVALVYVVPGAVLMLVAWPFILVLARRAGASVIMRHLPSRPIDVANPVERQLSNVVEEMAIAAGVQPPSVRIIESSAVNALAVGLRSDDAVLLATEGFLDNFNRDERQAIVAHLVGSVGNGDLEIAATILSVFATWGLIALILEAPYNARRRFAVRRFVRLAAVTLKGRAEPNEAEDVLDHLLSGSSWDMTMIDDIYEIQPRSVRHALTIMFIQLPVIAVLGLASITARMSSALYTAIGLGPWLAAMWRARRRLADASAVQLTRNPTALAHAVATFDKNSVEVEGGWVAYFLFPVWVPVTAQNANRPEAASNVIGMRLEAAPRTEDIVALGAMLDAAVHRPDLRTRLARLGTWKDLRTAVVWGVVAIAFSFILIVATLAAASVILIVIWKVLDWLTPG